jgi:hypothetical protein
MPLIRTHFHMIVLLVRVLSQTNPFHALTFCLYKIHFYIILPFTSRSLPCPSYLPWSNLLNVILYLWKSTNSEAALCIYVQFIRFSHSIDKLKQTYFCPWGLCWLEIVWQTFLLAAELRPKAVRCLPTISLVCLRWIMERLGRSVVSYPCLSN